MGNISLGTYPGETKEFTGTYNKDGHAASATDDGEGQAVGAQGEGDEGEDEDGDLDVEEPDRLRARHADGGESFCAHGDGVLSTGGVGVEAVFAGVLGWSRIEIVAHKKTRQAKMRRRGGGPGHLYSRPMHASFLLISHLTPPDHKADAMAATNGGRSAWHAAAALATRRD